MIGGVANQMSQRFGERVENAFIEICVLARDFECDFLVEVLGDIAHDARKSAEKLLDGHHANFHHRLLQLAQDPRLKCESIGKLSAQRILGVAPLEFSDGCAEASTFR